MKTKDPFDPKREKPALRAARLAGQAPSGPPPDEHPVSTFPETPASRAAKRLAAEGVPSLLDEGKT